MNRPEKKVLNVASDFKPRTYMSYELGYNACHDEFTEWLPSATDIELMIHQYSNDFGMPADHLGDKWITLGGIEDLAKALSKRLGRDE